MIEMTIEVSKIFTFVLYIRRGFIIDSEYVFNRLSLIKNTILIYDMISVTNLKATIQ